MPHKYGVRLFDVVLNVTCVLALAVLAYAFIREDGILTRAWQRWLSERREVRAVREEWPRARSGGARLDKGTGSVQLVEFADYQCPYCRQEHFILQEVMDTEPGLGVVYRHAPSDRHPAAWGAARAAICAESSGRFRELHAILFETMQWQTDTNWIAVARIAGINDSASFRRCLEAPATQRRLEEDREMAQRLGFSATPGFVGLGGRATGLAAPAELLRLAAKDR